MCRTKIFIDTLRIVSEHTEIPSDDILGKSRRAEVVDARCILVHFLMDEGLNASEISSLIHISDHSVRRLNRIYEWRKLQRGNLIARNSDAIRTQLGQEQ